MKNQRQARIDRSKSATVPQSQNAPTPVRTLPDPKVSPKNWTPEQMAAHQRMRERKMDSQVSIPIAFNGNNEQPDERLAIFIADIIGAYAPDFWEMLNLNNREIAEFGELVEIADEVARYGVELCDAESVGVPFNKPFPLIFDAPGYARYHRYESPQEVLFYLSFFIDNNRDAIVERILGKSVVDQVGKLDLAECLAICQAIQDRAGGDEEIEACDYNHTVPRLAQLAWKMKAEFYSSKLQERLEGLRAAQEADRKMVASRDAA